MVVLFRRRHVFVVRCVCLLTHFGLLQCYAPKDGFEWYLTVFILELDLIYESASSYISVVAYVSREVYIVPSSYRV